MLNDNFGVSAATALVTGGGGEIGFAIADAFVRRGVKTYICGRDEARCINDAVALSAHGACIGLTADLSTAAGIKDFAAKIAAHEQQLDILVNNAAPALLLRHQPRQTVNRHRHQCARRCRGCPAPLPHRGRRHQ